MRKRSNDDDVVPSKRIRTSQDDWGIQAGRILKVRLRNFMNHAEFDYKPTERLNFLNGSNGSGKSAILTAIVFGLGGTARMTNRGASNHGLIRQGQSSATVEISLYNGGENSYKEDIYGDVITVVRSVMASGGGSYKLKDARGRIVRDKKVKEELERILTCFSIQVDNPIAILHQDAAKTFLYKCEPAKLYEFFMKASQLEECKQDYNKANTEKDVANGLLADRSSSLGTLESEVQKWKKKFQFHQRVDKQRGQLDPLRAELAWSMVRSLREDHDNAGENISVCQKKIEVCHKKIQEETEKQKEKKKEKMEVEREIQDVASAADNAEGSLDELRRSARKARELEKNANRSVQEIQRQKKSKSDELESLRSAINKIRSGESEREYEVAEERKRVEIQKLETDKAQIEAQIATRETHMVNLKESVIATLNSEHELRAKMTEAKSNLERKVREIKSMESRRDNKLFMFGEQMPKLVDLIKANASKFKTLPIGPVGFHIELVKEIDAAEATVIENELRSILRTFLVSNFEDSRMLQLLSAKCNMRLTIITTHFSDSVYDVTKGKCCDAKYKTIFDRLIINDHNVANYLLDSKNIEKVLIIPDEIDALHLLNRVETVPRNCKYALTYTFGQYYPAPNSRSYSVRPERDFNRVLQCSVEQFVEKLKQECVGHRNACAEAERELLEIRETKKEHDRQLLKAEDDCKALRRNLVNVSTRLERIRSEAAASKPPDISALEEDMERYEEDVMDLEKKLKKVEEKFDAAKQECQIIQQTLSEKEEEIQSRVRSTEPLTEKLSGIEKLLVKLEHNKNHFHKKIESYKTLLEDTQKTFAKKKAMLDQQVAKAVKWSEIEVETDRKPEVIHREIVVLETSLKRMEGHMETKEEVAEQYEKISVFYEQIKHQVDSLKDTLSNLDRMLQVRKKGFMTIRASVGRNIQMNFSTRLQTRKFIGELIFQHKNNLLDITVCPQGAHASRKSDLKNLSGGEKSYATISLILAMWDAIQPPFRCLDEFDVFMDSVNRRIAIDQITTYAKETRKFQYIFLTPLSVESVGNDEDIQIVQLQKNNG